MASGFLHESLTNSLLREMASGAFRDGQRFHSLRHIGRLWKVSPPTVASSLRWLTGRGLLRSRSRRGYFLTPGFQQKAQLLLRKSPVTPLAEPSTLEQKARRLRGKQGGRVALLLESSLDDDGAPDSAGKLPAGLSPSILPCARAFLSEGARLGFAIHCFSYRLDGKDTARRAAIRRSLETGGFVGAVAFCRSGHKAVRPLLEPMLARHLPVIIMYDDCQGLPVHSIALNNTGIGYDAVRYLYRMGHRRITVLAPRSTEKHHRDRIRGCLLAASEGGCRGVTLTVLKLRRTEVLPPAARRHFVNRSTRPTAVFATWSLLLEGVASLLRELGLSVPEDVSLIVSSSRGREPFLDSPLDTLDLGLGARVGRMAVRHLHRLQAGEALGKSVLLEVVHKKRGSVAQRPGAGAEPVRRFF